ncbi:MAG: ral secretion pathway protein GspG [Herbaspirillum sp.]|nr:ral secretion pathway protein GspG [Herbaspirillum sp.]
MRRRGGAALARMRGFTLIELMVSLALLATLAMAVLPATELAARRDQEQQLRQALRDIRGAIDAYKTAADEGRVEKIFDASGYPPDLDILESGVTDKKSVKGGKLYFLRKLPRDPMCRDCEGTPAAQTWRLRSYDSAHDAPQAGADVFDVSSTNSEEGLNGIPYEQW